MRRRLFAVALAAAAVAAVPATASATAARECGGVVDVDCTGRVCPTDCWTRECAVWIDVRHNPQTALCL